MDNLKIRGNIIIIFIGLIFIVFIVRLFSIQVLSDDYARKADRYVIKTKSIIPPRGNIYNRTGDIYVSNQPIFNMLITPNELTILDTCVLVEYLGMTSEEIRLAIKKAKKYSNRKESVIARHIEPEIYGALQEQIWNYRGISFNASTKRQYQYRTGSNILGYISEVNPREIEASNGKYFSGDLIGKSGIERSHDTTLRGTQGKQKVLKDVHSREVGPYANGDFDIDPVKGKDLMLGLDTELQAFGEHIMAGKKGSIVAIEPATGEILAFISAPAYDPSMLAGREFHKNWRTLQKDTLNPLFNRPLMAEYPPGSIFKVAVALAALNEGIITKDTYYSCGGGFKRNKGKPGCRFHITPLHLPNAIKHSCNSYFAATYVDFLHHPKYADIYEGYSTWYRYMALMGIGQKLNVDLPYEKAAKLPTSAMYDNTKRWYGRNRWSAMTIISNAIGQGEILMTPLQMANLAAIIGNKGKYLPPHFLRATKKVEESIWQRISYDTVYTRIDVEHYHTVIDAMEQVVATGTARRAFIDDIDICGKTGTVENPHGDDHAVFIGFAPKDNPRIAIAVILENAGGGGRWAAPTASLMIEKYLKRKIEKKKFEYNRILTARFNP